MLIDIRWLKIVLTGGAGYIGSHFYLISGKGMGHYH